MNHNRRIWLIAGLLFVCAIGATTTCLHAQANPLDRDKPGQPANPTTTDPGTQVGRLFVPEYIKPGARLIYSSGSALEPDDPTKPV